MVEGLDGDRGPLGLAARGEASLDFAVRSLSLSLSLSLSPSFFCRHTFPFSSFLFRFPPAHFI